MSPLSPSAKVISMVTLIYISYLKERGDLNRLSGNGTQEKGGRKKKRPNRYHNHDPIHTRRQTFLSFYREHLWSLVFRHGCPVSTGFFRAVELSYLFTLEYAGEPLRTQLLDSERGSWSIIGFETLTCIGSAVSGSCTWLVTPQKFACALSVCLHVL